MLKIYVTSFCASVWLCALAFADDLLLGSKICRITCNAWAPLWTESVIRPVVCMSRIFLRYLWFMFLLKYEGPRTVQSGWNFNSVAIYFLENVPNIVLHWASVITHDYWHTFFLYRFDFMNLSLMPTFIDHVEDFKLPEAASISP